jgi:DMSO/TMAO reductase YedYZ molybdopterin-dependent catalytic subunit
LRGLEFLTHDQAGFWELAGYNNNADVWREERYA